LGLVVLLFNISIATFLRRGVFLSTLVRRALSFKIEFAVAVLNMGTVATGFLLQIIVLRLTGASRGADVYFATAAIPQVVLSITMYVVSGAMMPRLARLQRPRRIATVWGLLAITAVVGLPVAGLLYATAPVWAAVVFPGFAGETMALSVRLAALAVLTAPFAVATSILSAFLYAERRFVQNEAIALVAALGLALIAGMAVPAYGIVALGWLVLARFVAQACALTIFLPLTGWGGARDDLRAIASKARSLLAGAVYFKSDLLVDRYLLSLAPAGALSVIVFGQSIYVAASGVIGQALANTATPALATAHEAGDGAAFRAVMGRNLAIIGLAACGLVAVGIALVPPLAAALTTRRIVDGDVDLRWVLVLFGGLPIGACLGTLLANGLYALGDARSPTLMSMVTFTLFLIGKIIVFTSFGLYVFCALTSIYYLCNMVLLAWLLRWRMRKEFGA
jgi:putative peptidoglycan lipid II flippase